MKRPDLYTRMAGHPLGCLVVNAAGMLMMLAWLSLPDAPIWAGIAGIAICWSALAAYRRRRAWLRWEREWAAASGEVPPRRLSAKTWLALSSLAAMLSPVLWQRACPEFCVRGIA